MSLWIVEEFYDVPGEWLPCRFFGTRQAARYECKYMKSFTPAYRVRVREYARVEPLFVRERRRHHG